MRRILLCLALLLTPLAAHAGDEPYNRVDFQVEAGREIGNDLLIARMQIDIQDKLPANLSQRVNAAMNEALKQAKAFPTVKVSSGNQQSFPVHGKQNQIDAWRGHAEIRIESRDFKSAGMLIAQLQPALQMANLEFAVSPEARQRTENELIGEAIKAFRQRAEMIRNSIGAQGYKPVALSISTSGGPQPLVRGMMRATAMADAAMPPAEFESGDTRLTVQITSTIELK
ncbi:MAG: SIMPL domain-containing protein [Gallionella sp.]|nr:SIMPL domain-containing protein [Gallionella sp.]